MSKWYVREWVPCPECDGCGKVWVLLKGAGIQTTQTCGHCLGFARVSRLRKPTKAEIEEMTSECTEAAS
jgi:hypothetical protein